MEKLAYLVFDDAEASGDALRERLLARVGPALQAAGAHDVVVSVQDGPVAEGRPIRNSDPPVRALVSFWLQSIDDRGPCEAALEGAGRRLAGYLVCESRPLVHERVPGARSPGMNQVTCIARKSGLSDDAFFDYWTTEHKRVAVETQATTGYVRNVVVRPLLPGSPAWDAIVEETFPIEALTDPKVFYAAPDDATLRANLERMMQSCQRFLDFGPMECTHMSEYTLGAPEGREAPG